MKGNVLLIEGTTIHQCKKWGQSVFALPQTFCECLDSVVSIQRPLPGDFDHLGGIAVFHNVIHGLVIGDFIVQRDDLIKEGHRPGVGAFFIPQFQIKRWIYYSPI